MIITNRNHNFSRLIWHPKYSVVDDCFPFCFHFDKFHRMTETNGARIYFQLGYLCALFPYIYRSKLIIIWHMIDNNFARKFSYLFTLVVLYSPCAIFIPSRLINTLYLDFIQKFKCRNHSRFQTKLKVLCHIPLLKYKIRSRMSMWRHHSIRWPLNGRQFIYACVPLNK